ncbi:MAG: alpha/beta fold hydrolase [Aquabacterium sp.]
MSTPKGVDIELQARDGLKLRIVHYPVAPSRGVIVFLHGLSEHADRHKLFAAHLNRAGWRVLVPDLRGHGHSGGVRGGIQQDDDPLHDLAAVLDLAEQLAPGELRVLVGHSLGGAVAARFVSALAQPPETAPWVRPVDGLVLSAPALEPTMGMLQKALLSTMGRLMQDLPLPIVFKPEWGSSDPDVIREFEQDPLAHKKVTPRLAAFIVQHGRIAMSRAAQWTRQTLVVYTPADRLISPRACEEFAALLPQGLSSIRSFPDLAHDMLRDRGKEKVYQAITQWLDQVFPADRQARQHAGTYP